MSKSECKCDACVNACKCKPGWFKPGEVEKVAKHLGVTLKDCFDTMLGVDWFENGPEGEDIFVLAPAITTMIAGREYPGDPSGECIFFEDGLCVIHEVKPYECSRYIHTDGPNEVRHEMVALSWVEHQTEIMDLLGRKPKSESYSGGLFKWGGWGGF